jgi:hypothetical protein
MLMLSQMRMESRNDLLHTLPPPTWPHKRQSLSRMDRRTYLWPHNAPNGRHNSGPLYITLGKEETIHAYWDSYRIVLAIHIGMDC